MPVVRYPSRLLFAVRCLIRVTPRQPCAAVLPALAAGLLLAAEPGAADTFVLRAGSQLVGEVTTVAARHEDTLTDIGRAHRVGYEEIVWANPGVDVWLPGEGTTVRLPRQFILPAAPAEGIVVNIAEYRLYHYARRDGVPSVSTFPISIGRMDWATPLGHWSISAKQKNPTWYPPESIRREHMEDGRGPLARAVPPGPDNPLGKYAMRLSLGSYLIHGTNRPVGVGMQVTHGCIRMFPEDIEWLFAQVPVGTPVSIVNQPYKFGWAADGLYLEVHPHLEGDAGAADQGMTDLMARYVRATEGRPAEVDWPLVDEVYRAKLGIPVRVGGPAQVADAAGGSAGAGDLPARDAPARRPMDAVKYPRR